MSVNKNDLVRHIEQLKALRDKGVPDIMSEIAVGEGLYAVKEARRICKNEYIINNGAYRQNWKSDSKAKRAGNKYIVRFYNPLDYASHLEYGFRSHFVPGHWEGYTFVYNKNDPEGGMFVGPKDGYVRGHFVLRRAAKNVRDTQRARVTRKIEKTIRKYTE